MICKYIDQKGLAAMLTCIQSTGVAPKLNVRIAQAIKHASKRSIPALKPRVNIVEVQNRVSVTPQIGLVSSKLFDKKDTKRILPLNFLKYPPLFCIPLHFLLHIDVISSQGKKLGRRQQRVSNQGGYDHWLHPKASEWLCLMLAYGISIGLHYMPLFNPSI